MAGAVNKVILVGNLGRDPEVKMTSGGARVANLNLATSERWIDKSTGEVKERTEWHRVVIWNEHIVSVAERFLKKGSLIYIEGTLQTRKYTANDGTEKYTTEVVLPRFRGELTMLGGRDNGGAEAGPAQQSLLPPPAAVARAPSPAQVAAPPRTPGSAQPIDLDDEIPFATIDELCITPRRPICLGG